MRENKRNQKKKYLIENRTKKDKKRRDK